MGGAPARMVSDKSARFRGQIGNAPCKRGIMASSTTDDRIQQRTGASGDAQHSLVGEVSSNARCIEQLRCSRLEQQMGSAQRLGTMQ